MTFKQLLIRYLKEMGGYSAVSIESNRFHIKRIDSKDIISLFEYARVYSYLLYRRYHNVYEFISAVAVNEIKIKKGDIVEAKTQDGKYVFSYVVNDVWYSNFSVITENGGTISLYRITSINGEPYDFNNCWEFKNKNAFIRKNGK